MNGQKFNEFGKKGAREYKTQCFRSLYSMMKRRRGRFATKMERCLNFRVTVLHNKGRLGCYITKARGLTKSGKLRGKQGTLELPWARVAILVTNSPRDSFKVVVDNGQWARTNGKHHEANGHNTQFSFLNIFIFCVNIFAIN